MPIDSKRVQAVFLAAVEEADRTGILDRECGDDVELRRRVEALLKANDEPAPDLDEPAVGFAKPSGTIDYAPITEQPGSMIGPYKLKEQIGEGGFGLVFVAEQQEPVKRKVALKVIKPGMDTREVMARFTAERQALALMDHPNIARVLDAGATDSGRPYFVMELVRGIPITEYCDQNQLAPRDRLDLFVSVCQAVQHAHQKGIIHRDIKPSNVLVTSHDGKPVAKVIDFGVAKAINQQLTDRSVYTNFAQMVGTPLYMSPEQAEMSGLDIDTRSDIYSLGVLLYELLTGTTPLEKKQLREAAYDEIRRLIREEEPQKPSTRLSTSESIASIAAQRHIEPAKLSRLMRGDLDWITMKALEKDRTRRYETANGLARDIQRYLSDEPVEACPPSATYRLRKFAKKNRAALATTTGLVLLLVSGISVSAWQAVRARQAERVAVGALQAEAEQRNLAEVKEGEANDERSKAVAERDAKDKALTAETKARTQTFEALVAMTDDVIERLFAKQPTLGEDERAFLRKVMGLYEAHAADRGGTPSARYAVAVGKFRIAKLHLFLGERSEAAVGYREAIRVWEKLADDFPAKPAYRMELARSLSFLGSLLVEELGKRGEAESADRQALAIQEKLVAEFPVEPAYYRVDLATTHLELGYLLAIQGKQLEAETHVRQALTIQEKLATDFPEKPQYRSSLAAGHNTRGELLNKMGKKAEAELAFRRASAIQRRLVADFPARPEHRQELARILNNLGVMLPDDVILTESLAIREKLVSDFPASHDYRTELAGSFVNHGNMLIRRRQAQDALEWYAKAIPLLEAVMAREPGLALNKTYLRNAYSSRADALTHLQRHAEAVKDLDRSIDLDEGPERPRYKLQRAISLAHAGERDEAAAEAEAQAAGQKASANTLYDCACVFAVCSTAKKDDGELTRKYTERAMALLKMAVQAGYKNAAHMKKDTDLDPLREREDFKKLMAELEKSSEKK